MPACKTFDVELSNDLTDYKVRFSLVVDHYLNSLSVGFDFLCVLRFLPYPLLECMKPKKKTFCPINFIPFFTDFLIELLASSIYHEDGLLCHPESPNSVCGIAISISPNERGR